MRAQESAVFRRLLLLLHLLNARGMRHAASP